LINDHSDYSLFKKANNNSMKYYLIFAFLAHLFTLTAHNITLGINIEK